MLPKYEKTKRDFIVAYWIESGNVFECIVAGTIISRIQNSLQLISWKVGNINGAVLGSD